MAGYLGPKAIQYNVDNSNVENDSNVGGDLTVGGDLLVGTRKTGDRPIQSFFNGTSLVGSIGATQSGVNIYCAGGAGKSGVEYSNNAWRPWYDGARADNSVDVGTVSNRFKDLYLSGGVYLGGTDAAHKLDEYEEGSWTVTMYDSSSGGNASSTQVTGRYTKIGQQVIASFDAFNDVSTSGLTAGGIAYVTLPFAASNTGRACGPCQLDNVKFTGNGTMVTASVSDNASRASLNTSGSNIADVAVKVSDFNGTTSDIVNWTLSYRTDA